MKRISFYQTWNPHQFHYDKLEISQEFPIDKPDEECIAELKQRIENMARVVYPWLFEPANTYTATVGLSHDNSSSTILVDITTSKSDEKEAILNCKTVPELQGFRLIKDKSPELKEAYAKKLKELLSMDSVSDLNKNGKEVYE